jgi:hypothetical protein
MVTGEDSRNLQRRLRLRFAFAFMHLNLSVRPAAIGFGLARPPANN